MEVIPVAAPVGVADAAQDAETEVIPVLPTYYLASPTVEIPTVVASSPPWTPMQDQQQDISHFAGDLGCRDFVDLALAGAGV